MPTMTTSKTVRSTTKTHRSTGGLMEMLSTLPADQLREFHARASFLLGQRSSTGTVDAARTGCGNTDDTDARLVYEQIGAALKRCRVSVLPYPVAQRSAPWFLDYRKGSALLLDYVREHMKPRDRVALTAAVRLVVDVLVRAVGRSKRPGLSFRRMAYELSWTPERMDDAFPGYRQSGLLSVLLKTRSPH